jgi:hypothetical protein
LHGPGGLRLHLEEVSLEDFDTLKETIGSFGSESVSASGSADRGSDPEKWPDSVQGE